MRKNNQLFKCCEKKILRLLFLMSAFAVLNLSAFAQLSDNFQSDKADIKGISYRDIADKIIVGFLSESEFAEMNFTDTQKVEIFKEIRNLRGWKISDEELISALTTQTMIKELSCDTQNLSGCSQFIELESGSSYSAYPVSRTTPNSGECGSDNDDIILIYNTPKGSRANPDQIRVWTNLWWVRLVISTYGGVSANSLCTMSTRVCMGSRGRALGNDLNYLYLWHK